MKKKVLVILSGGQDSTTCLFMAKSWDWVDELHAITFDYGQRHKIEIESAKKVAELAGVVSHEIVALPEGILKSTSPLVSNTELEQYENYEQMDSVIGDRVELTFVPMRNALFFTIAANRAAALGCDFIVTGVCQQDNANYPDCTAEFRGAFTSMAEKALANKHFDVLAPLIFMSKSSSVITALRTPGAYEALAYSHTSYDGKYPPTDMNHANVLRAHGFEKANIPDPLVVRAWLEGLMELPETENYDIVLKSKFIYDKSAGISEFLNQLQNHLKVRGYF